MNTTTEQQVWQAGIPVEPGLYWCVGFATGYVAEVARVAPSPYNWEQGRHEVRLFVTGRNGGYLTPREAAVHLYRPLTGAEVSGEVVAEARRLEERYVEESQLRFLNQRPEPDC